MTTFRELGLNSDLIKSLEDLGFSEPTPIQEKTIPFILNSKKDLIALAQTGTGKTAAFGLPILNQIDKNNRNLQAIILCPTRELCLQITQDLKKMAKYSKENIIAIYGGSSIELQIRAVKNRANIIVGTPGRVHDLIRRRILNLQTIKFLVLDEADEMLDMGFKDDLDAILDETPETRQTLLFSATISKSVRLIAKNYMQNAEEISIGKNNIGADKVSHEYYVVDANKRFEALKRILDSLPGVYGILFCRTRNETQEIAAKLKQAHYDTEALHGDVSQSMRSKIMADFKNKKRGLLVATDVAARGIDISDLSHVINYNLPDSDESYTHRSGRTGRAQKTGIAISIVSPREVRRIKDIEYIINKEIEYKKIPDGKEICQIQIKNFIEEIEKSNIKDFTDEEFFSEINKNLKKTKKEDLIRHLISYRFGHLLNYYKDSYNLNVRVPDVRSKKDGPLKEGVDLKINLGKAHGFDIQALFTIINSNKNLNGMEIGKISLMPEFSFFAVEKEQAAEVIQTLNGQKFRNHEIEIETDVEIKDNSKTYKKRSEHNNYNKNHRSRNRSFNRRRFDSHRRKRY
ncbi:MAG: DEAD/DEAH box helicase [Patescibacteria group bacterium]